MPFLATDIQVDGQPVYIETSELVLPASRGPHTAGVSPTEVIAKLEKAGEAAGEICVSLFQHMREKLHDAKPDQVNVQFGITLEGEAGIPLVTKGTVQAAFQISATWTLSSTVPTAAVTSSV
jgi:hypothetical protein